MSKIILHILIFVGCFNSYGQDSFSIKGKTTDENNVEIPFVSVLLFSKSDSSFTTGITASNNGEFELLYLKPKAYFLKFHSIGFNDTTFSVTINSKNIDLGNVVLSPIVNELSEVMVVGKTIRISQNGDTTEFNAQGYKVNPDANIEDLILKMPGITIENGKLTANGESVDKVLVDGDEFFGNDALTAIQNLPANVVNKIQVTDSKSEQSQHSDFMSADSYKTINIITKNPDSKLIFGKIYAGGGTDDRYNSGGSVNYFNGKQKLSLIGTINNVNQQNFSNEDLLGINSKNGGMSKRPLGNGGTGSSFSQSGNDFFIQSQDGINTTNAIGFNYIDKWGEKLTVNGNYFYNQVYNETSSSLNRIYSSDDSLVYNEVNDQNNLNNNHRVKLKMDYKINNQYKLLFTFQGSFQNNLLNDLINSSFIDLNRIESDYLSFKNGYNLNTNLLFLHSFKKDGRTLSLNLNSTQGNSIGNDSLFYSEIDLFLDSINSLTQQFSDSRFQLKSYYANVNFSEKLNENAKILLSYNASLNHSLNSRYTSSYNDTSESYIATDELLSSELSSSIFAHNTGVNYQYSKRKNTLNIGVTYRYTEFLGAYHYPNTGEIFQDYHNLLPSVMWMHKFNSSSNLRMFVRTSNTIPSVSQLQTVIDNSNPQQLVIGNSNLVQEKNTMLLSRFSKTNYEKGNSFFAFFMLKHTADYIGQSIYSAQVDTIIVGDVLLPPNSQLTSYDNFEDMVTMRSFFTYGLPIEKLKCNLNINTGLSYSITPGEINEVRNTSSVTSGRIGFVLSSNFSETVDFSLTYRANRNWNNNDVLTTGNTVYSTHNVGLKFNLLLKNRILFNTRTMLNAYQGIEGLENNTPVYTSVSLAYKWLKKKNLETKISVYDLFNQNIGASQEVTPIYVESSVNELLQRYLMFSLTYRFNKIIIK